MLKLNIYCTIDVETTGFSRTDNRIIQLTCKVMGSDNVLDVYLKHKDYNWDPKTYEFQLKHDPEIIKKIEEKGLMYENNYEALRRVLSEYWKSFGIKNKIQLHENVIFVGYNNDSFDLPFLQKSWGDSTKLLHDLFPTKTIDLFKIVKDDPKIKNAKEFGIIPNIKLASVAEYYNIKMEEGGNFHNSFYDVLITEKIFHQYYKREER